MPLDFIVNITYFFSLYIYIYLYILLMYVRFFWFTRYINIFVNIFVSWQFSIKILQMYVLPFWWPPPGFALALLLVVLVVLLLHIASFLRSSSICSLFRQGWKREEG